MTNGAPGAGILASVSASALLGVVLVVAGALSVPLAVQESSLSSLIYREQAVVTFQFLVDVFEVFPNRADADPVEPRDLLGTQPVREEGEDVQLANGEVRAFARFIDVRTVSTAYRGG